MKWYVGTSGWSYASWKGLFYPTGTPPQRWLAFYARHFNAVEINNTFYRPPTALQIQKWEDVTPNDSRFAVKASRIITHQKKLYEVQETVTDFLEPLSTRKRSGPIIFQLPPSFPQDIKRLEQFLNILPKTERFAIEFRHLSWHNEHVYKLLRQHNVAFCMFEKATLYSSHIMTADFAYVRLHGRERGYKGNYSLPILKEWHSWLKDQGQDVYIFFDNTAENIDAVDNALAFKDLI